MSIWEAIQRTPGALTLKILTIGFLVAGVVTYIDGEESPGPYFLAAIALVATEIVLVIVQLIRKAGDKQPPKN